MNHLLTGRSSSRQRIQQLLPFLNRSVVETRVLDAGCGSGMATAAFSELGFKNVVGFDLGLEPIGLPIARLRRHQNQATVHFIQANGYHIPLADCSVDLCWCSFVIEHVPDPPRLLRETFRVLSPEGILYLSTNNRLWPFEPHSGLLMATWLPTLLAERYARWRKRWPKWEAWDVFPRTHWQLERWSDSAGFTTLARTHSLVGPRARHYLRRFPLLRHCDLLFPNLYLILRKPKPA